MTRLSVNINKIATLRNARGGNIPNLKQVAIDCQKFGAQGITIHPRPDERHIKRSDVFDIKPIITTEFNIEGYPSKEFIDLVCQAKPAQVTLVPDSPSQLTSNQGWNTLKHKVFLIEVVREFKLKNIRTSIFIGTSPELIEAAAKTGTDRVELYTEPYAADFYADAQKAIAPFINAAKLANNYDLGINAGHDLNLDNLRFFQENIPGLLEVSIGHALIADALYFGLERTVQLYLDCLK